MDRILVPITSNRVNQMDLVYGLSLAKIFINSFHDKNYQIIKNLVSLK